MKKIFFFVFIFTSTALSASLASCASPQGTVASQATVTFPPPTSTPKQTELTEFNGKTRFEGNDPRFLVGGGESPGRLVSLPQDVLAFLRNNHEGPIINGDNFIARVSADGVCTVFTTDHLVDSGAVLSDVNDDRVVFSVNGTATVGQFRFPVPDGVACVASLAQEGSGFAPGTILVRFFRDNGKAGAQILNEEPIRPLVNAPNRIELVRLESGFQLVTTGADGQEIETQTVDTKGWAESLLPPEVKEKFELAGVDITKMQNAKYDKDGLHITLESGEIVTFENEKLKDIVFNGKNYNVAQIRVDGNILFAFDTVDKKWIQAETQIQPDKNNPENFHRIKTWEELKTQARLEELLLPDFSEDTYYPDASKIYREYSYKRGESRENPGFSFTTPFGVIEDFSKMPFRYASYTILEKGEDRTCDIYILTQQVYDPNTGGFSTMHFTFEDFEPGYGLDFMNSWMGKQEDGRFLLPYYTDFKSGNRLRASGNLLDYYSENDIDESKMKALVFEFFDTGIVPQELRYTPLLANKMIMDAEYIG